MDEHDVGDGVAHVEGHEAAGAFEDEGDRLHSHGIQGLTDHHPVPVQAEHRLLYHLQLSLQMVAIFVSSLLGQHCLGCKVACNY